MSEMSGGEALSWRDQFLAVIEDWRADGAGVVISADVDGLMSCALLALVAPVHVIGVYTTRRLILLDGATPMDAARALWLDHDVSAPGVRCIGQHLIHLEVTDTLPLREKMSFNPNGWFHQAWRNSFRGRGGKQRDKYPYGTCHFIAHALDFDLGGQVTEAAALLAHADGTWRTVVDYEPNARIWYELMFQGDEFLSVLLDQWHSDPDCLEMHWRVVEKLHELGVMKQQSRAKIAQLLPIELKRLTGSQGPQFRVEGESRSIEATRRILGYCAAQVGSAPSMGKVPTWVVTGVVKTPYPDQIVSLDELMVEERIFSHAFTQLRMLRYTTEIDLSQ